MKNCLIKVLFIIGLIAITSFSQAPTTTATGLNYDPSTGVTGFSLITTGTQSSGTTPLWFYTYKNTANDIFYQVIKLDLTQANKFSIVSLKSDIKAKAAAGLASTKFISKDLTCALITTDTDKFDAYDFTANPPTLKGTTLGSVAVPADLDNLDIKAVVAVAADLDISQMGNGCKALKLKTDYFAWTGAKFQLATAPTGATPVLTDDLMFAVSKDKGVQALTAKAYAQVTNPAISATQFLDNSKVLSYMVPGSTTYRVVVATRSATLLKWRVYTIDPSTAAGVAANGKIFTNAGSDSTSQLVLSGSPTMNLVASPTLRYFFIYGAQDATKNYAVGRWVNWQDNAALAADQTIDTTVGSSFLTTASLTVSVSERFVYARSSSDHAGFLLNGNKLVVQFAKTSFTAITNLQNSLINDDAANKFFSVYQTKFVAASGVTSADSLGSISVPTVPTGTAQIAPIWDPTNAGKYTQVKMYPELNPSTATISWISQLSDGTKKYLQAFSYTNSSSTAATTTSAVQIGANSVNVVAVSSQASCVLVDDGTNFVTYTVSAGTIVKKGQNAKAAGAAPFQLSDDCNTFKNTAGLYRFSSATAYTADTVKPADLLTAYTFAPDFSYGVSATTICKTSTAECVAQTGRTSQSYLTNKMIFKNANYLIIFSWDGTANWKLQVNTIASPVKKINEFTSANVLAGSVPSVQVTSSFNRILVKHTVTGGISWQTKTFLLDQGQCSQLTLPSPHNAVQTKNFKYDLSDNFLYIRSITAADNAGTINLLSYALVGNSFIVASAAEAMDPSLLSGFGYQSSIAIEQAGKSALVSQLSNKALDTTPNTATTGLTFVRLNKIVKSTVNQVLGKTYTFWSKVDSFFSPNADGTVVNSIPNSFFGRFTYTVGTGATLRAAYYDTAAATGANKIKFFDADTKTTSANIRTITSNADCAMTSSTTAASIYIHFLNYTSGSTTSQQLSAVTLAANMPNDAVASVSSNFMAFRSCSGFVINQIVFIRNSTATGTSKYLKNDDASAWRDEAYDRRGNFAWTADNKLFMLNSSTLKFVDTGISLNSSFYKAAVGNQRVLTANSAKTIVILDSSAKNGGNYEYAIEMFYYTGTAWVKVFSLSGTSTGVSSKYYVQRSDEYQTFALITNTATGSKLQVRKITFSATPTVTLYTAPTQFTGTSTKKLFVSCSNNYLYLRSAATDNTATTAQYYYFIDKVQTKLTQKTAFTRTTIPVDQQTGFVNMILLQGATNLFSYVHSTIDSNKVYAITKADLGVLQSTTRTTDSMTTGVVVVNGVTTLCNAGCTTCTAADASICTQCGGGYYLSGSACIKIRVTNCKIPSGTDSCNGCFEGFFLVTSPTPVKCTKCSDVCLTCSSLSTCLTCKPGFKLLASTCVACIDNCDDCATPVAPALCTKCSVGYSYNADTTSCDQCSVPGCSTCTVSTCSVCADGYQLSSNKCLPCPTGCSTCNAATGVCLTCRTQLVLSSGKCIQKCRAPCTTCSTSPTTCTACAAGYKLNVDACVADLTCNTAGTCKACPIGYSLESSKCVQCTGGSNCQGCVFGNAKLCATCSRGFYLLSTGSATNATNTCTACSSQCTTCVDKTSCTSCADGFFLTSGSSLIASKCEVCSPQCKTCFGNAANCDSCATGFTRSGSLCIDPNGVRFSIGIQKPVASLTLIQSNFFFTSLVGLIKVHRRKCRLFGWAAPSSGSLRLLQTTGAVTTGQVDSSTPAATSDALASSVSSGSTVGGQSVTSATFTPVSSATTDEDWKYYRNVAIIVGVVIPVSLIIIFIIFFIGYKNGVWCNEQSKDKYPDHSNERIV